jgi:hypothetical protein
VVYCNWSFDSAACCAAWSRCAAASVGVGGLFELRGRDQVFFRLCLVAIELLLRIHETVLRGFELSLRAGGILLRIRRIEPGDDLPVLHHVPKRTRRSMILPPTRNDSGVE